MICDRVVWSRFLEAISTSAERNFFEQSYTHLSSILAKKYAVLSEVSSHCAFGRMPACHEDDGKPYLHQSSSGSSGKCPSFMKFGNDFRWRGTLTWISLSNVMLLHPKPLSDKSSQASTGLAARPGPPASPKNRNWPPFGPPFWSEWAPLGGLEVRNFDAGANFEPLSWFGPPFLADKNIKV